MTDRETLEAETLDTVSASYYYDLADSIDGMSDGETSWDEAYNKLIGAPGKPDFTKVLL